MAASIPDSTKGWEREGSLEGKEKKMKKAVVTLKRYRRGLVREKCSIEFNSWKMVRVDLNNSMQKYVDDLFKKQFQQWQFDLQQATEPAQVNDAAVDDPVDDLEEE
ncbi:cytochrome P450 CYP736A12-like [Pyrus ussuriensis x Pyrus communis]|uniref:Cytochrome P450 CYP736A12-like n=1 Tax=Pyrus ussuriensis x Pyrus communis TaxID=2448454 RepID=A0A5N5I0X7_9ROSA|nr:cytochrome P450 CYP736A12-like [Pyrus ussuriensis x Pyrus communis]